MHLLPALLLAAGLLAAETSGEFCFLCFGIQEAVKSRLGRIRSDPVINPSYVNAVIETHLGRDGDATNLDISFTNLQVIGLADFISDSVKFSKIGMGINPGMLNITIIIPELTTEADNYKILGNVDGVLNMNADGPCMIKLNNVTLHVHGLLYVTQLRVSDMHAEFSVGSFQIEMVNILGNMSDGFNEMLNEVGLNILDVLAPGLEDIAGKLLDKEINKMLPGKKSDVDVEIDTSFIGNEVRSLLNSFVSRKA